MNTVTRVRQIEPEVLDVLGNAQCDANMLRLIGQLDRKLYTRTNEVLEALGGKWNKKVKAHIFEGNAADLVDEVILTRTFSKTKQDFGFFETPHELVCRMVAAANISVGLSVLEPSAGRGAIANALQAVGAKVLCVELQEANASALCGAGHNVEQGDFLAKVAAASFDRVVMNPPFSKRADIHHIRHAMGFLKPGGELVAIASASVLFRQDKLASDFRDLVRANFGMIEALPDGTFKDSGTMVNTVMITMETEK